MILYNAHDKRALPETIALERFNACALAILLFLSSNPLDLCNHQAYRSVSGMHFEFLLSLCFVLVGVDGCWSDLYHSKTTFYLGSRFY